MLCKTVFQMYLCTILFKYIPTYFWIFNGSIFSSDNMKYFVRVDPSRVVEMHILALEIHGFSCIL